jgi:hypothetical protein
MLQSSNLFDKFKAVTEGTYEEAKEASIVPRGVWNFIDKSYSSIGEKIFEGQWLETTLNKNFSYTIDESASLSKQIREKYGKEEEKEVKEGEAGPENAGEGGPMEDTLESVLSEKDDKKDDKKEEWKDERGHDEAVRDIVRDSWKELFVDGAFKGGNTPTREEVQSEVEFQSKHGLDHREDASAIRYDAYKKVMKKIKNIVKKLDAESNETPEEEDTAAQAAFQQPMAESKKEEFKKREEKAKKDKKLQPKHFLGLKT